MRRGTGKNKRTKEEESEAPEVEEQDEVEPKTEENGDDADYVADKEEESEHEKEDDDYEEGTSKKGKKKSPAKKSGKAKKGKKGGRPVKKAAPPAESEDEEYEVEAIVDQRYMRGIRQFKVRWRGHGQEEDSWCKETDLHCQELIDEYMDENRSDDGDKKKKGRKRKAAKEEEEDEDEDTTEYEVKDVLEVKYNKNGTREFLIRWKGFSAKDDTWEPESHLSCTDLIDKLLSRVEKVRPAKKTKGKKSKSK